MPVLSNARHERFAQELAKGCSALDAYRAAGYSGIDKSLMEAASRLSRNVKVRSRVIELQAAVAEKAGIDEAWVLRRLAEEAEADLADLYKDGKLKPIEEWPLIWRTGLVAGLDIEEIKVGELSIGNIKKLRVSDRIKRIELIGKHVAVQAFRDRIEHTGANGGPIQHEDVSAVDRLSSRIAQLATRTGPGSPASKPH